jgi:phage terminase large subunit
MAEGSIYKDSWSDELLYDSKDEPPGLYNSRLMRYVAIDYGTTNPTVFLDIYDDGKLYWVTREYYWDSAVHMCQKTDAEYADDLVAFIGAGLRAKVIIDPSAASFKAEMTKRGIWHVDADNEVLEGIKKTSIVLNKRMVRIRRDKNEHGIKEMQTYAWDSNAAKRGEEKPLKMHDHWPDAFRYFVQTEVPQWRIAA